MVQDNELRKSLTKRKYCLFLSAVVFILQQQLPTFFLHKEITFLPSCQISANTSESECFYLPLFITDRYKLAVKF